jgi:negative regulator of genetic competence, sporulation and motility
MKEDLKMEEKIKEKTIKLFEKVEIGMDQNTNNEFLSPNLSIIYLYSKIKDKISFISWLNLKKDWKKLLGLNFLEK